MPCFVHNLVDWDSEMTKEEFKHFWDVIKEDNKSFSLDFGSDQLYQGIQNLSEDLKTYLKSHGFAFMAESTR